MTVGANESIARATRLNLLMASLLFLLSLVAFWFSPVSQVTDSHYSLLLSESLLKQRSFALDHYAIPRLEPQTGVRDDYVANGKIWQLELANNNLYYYFPPGSSILSIPYVAVAGLLGYPVSRSDGSYDPQAEVRLETGLAAILMAGFVSVVFITARTVLPLGWSVVVATAAGFGTQVWSSTSRALWSQTWEVLLVGLVVLLLFRREVGRRVSPVLIATLLAWIYFVRPSGAIVVLAVTVYLLRRDWPWVTKFLITGAFWGTLFLLYSWVHFNSSIPSYYKTSRLRLDLFLVALAGNVISPSRGLLVYVPIIVFVLFLLIRFRHYLRFKRMVVVSVFVVTAHLLLVSSFANRWGDWWGGASFGPRYLADLVPWFSALAIVGLDGMLHWRRQHAAPRSTQWKLMWTTGAVLLALSVMINARGALSQETWRWTQPINDRQMRALLWDWRHPQFLAGLQRPAPLVEVPLVGPGSRVDFDTPEAEKFLWYGWSGAEEGFRWSDGKEAAIVFGLNHVEELTLNLRASVFTGGKPIKPTVGMALNGNPLPVIEFNSSAGETYQIGLPKSLLAGQNVLTISMPDAASPRSAGLGDDDRLLGIRVYSIEFQRGDE